MHRREIQGISTFKSQVGGDRGNKGPQRAAREAKGNRGKQGQRPQRKTEFQGESGPRSGAAKCPVG